LDFFKGLRELSQVRCYRLFVLELLLFIIIFIIVIFLIDLLLINNFFIHFALFIDLVDSLIVPETLLLLCLVPDSWTVEHVFLELGLVDEHPLFVRALYFVLQVAAM
jgi:hypothetical protein